jgi:CRP-like cAMP-binding protein
VGTALERVLSVQLMHGASKPAFATLKAGGTLVRQGETGSDVYLVLDGVIRADRDGAQLAEYGPGAIPGERAHLETGVRTCTLVAVTPCRVAAVPASQLAAEALIELAMGHRHEEAAQGG